MDATPQALLDSYDSGRAWPAVRTAPADLDAAYALALAVRALRVGRGEQPRGFKIGFTNSLIWPRYGVFAPIWGTVWDTTLSGGDTAALSLDGLCQPRLEPEVVFGFGTTPTADATLQELFECIEWVAPGFEVVQSHCPDWKFSAAETVADGGLHARLRVGRRQPVSVLGKDAPSANEALARCGVRLLRDRAEVEAGRGSNVLGGPLAALHAFARELARCPGAPRLQAGDLVTTGTWTDAWPLAGGQCWRAEFDAPLGPLELRLA
ncbi:2-keto-4-pentenoate hydratase [Ramlibacter rhizophilus]|uniref:Hydratase n=1 Tax=Ramlibacter rhizophilus TaxID=1781167 RepID=A0A4Z0BPD9_9BURK|nr:fumarylacetoacetate hydrolase family protein [Ramlibacter rhizophilus]TFZ01176.1 hydratase [Ramlibacter rhizophilus]